jgi:GMP synthase PP-ATPase subunit
MSDLVERLRENSDMLKDGYQENLTAAWHTVAMKHAATDAIEAATQLEAKDKLIQDMFRVIINRCDEKDPKVKDVLLRAISMQPDSDDIPE